MSVESVPNEKSVANEKCTQMKKVHLNEKIVPNEKCTQMKKVHLNEKSVPNEKCIQMKKVHPNEKLYSNEKLYQKDTCIKKSNWQKHKFIAKCKKYALGLNLD